MKINNSRFYNREPMRKWRIDEDGHLRVTICALKEGVYDYGIEEAPQAASLPELRGLDTIREYISEKELRNKEALQSLEGKDIIVGHHDWQTPENYGEANIAGSVAGAPYVEAGELLVDAIIKCPEAIQNITSERTPENERYVEVSAGYDGDLVADGGTYNGERYDARQINFRFNHILLLPAGRGRCGSDVRIVNSKPEEVVRMAGASTTLKVRIGNAERTFRFSNEDDAKEAETMVEEERKFNAEQVAASLEEKDKLTTQIEELKAQLAEHDAHLAEARDQLASAMSEETQEVLAAEMQDQAVDEENLAVDEVTNKAEEDDEVLNEEQKEERKDEFLNAIRSDRTGARYTLRQRRENCVRTIMARQGVEIPSTWENTAFDAAFEALSVKARVNNERREKNTSKYIQRVVNGRPSTGNQVPASLDNRARVLNAMRVKKGGKNE